MEIEVAKNIAAQAAGEPSLWEITESCGVCGSRERTEIYPSNIPGADPIGQVFWNHYAKSQGFLRTNICKCAACGHLYASPFLKDPVLEACYAVSEFDNAFYLDSQIHTRTFKHYVELIEPHLNSRNTMIDVGSDVGMLIEAGLPLGFQKYLAVEPNHLAAKQARERLRGANVDFHEELYQPAHAGSGTASLVTFIHVLDHIKNPKEVLELAHDHLREGGVVAAVVHSSSSLLAKISGAKFPPFNLQHPHYFNRKSFAKIFERAGFTVDGIYATKNFYPLHHYVRYAPILPLGFRSWLSAQLEKIGWLNFSIPMPLGNMMIVASKRSATS